MLFNIYDFIVWNIATPLAIIALVVGGIFMMISAGNPGMMGLGKTIVVAAIIGLVLVFCSWLIIDTIITSMGGTSGSWSKI
jgi:type IV secretory pathway VirB2 component (pilin)